MPVAISIFSKDEPPTSNLIYIDLSGYNFIRFELRSISYRLILKKSHKLMDASSNFVQRISQSVIAVPPLARDPDGVVDANENRKLINHIESGGVNVLLYGGNAVFYHLRPSEYGQVLQMLHESVSPQTTVIPSVGPTYGLMMDHAEVLADFDFPTAMILPQRDITDWQGIVRGIRSFAEKYGKPLVLYLKFANWLPTAAVKSLFDEGVISWIKYAVVRENPSVDDELKRLVDLVPPERIVSGIGEQPAIIHMREFGLGGYTSGCVCLAPKRSMQMMQAIHNKQWDAAEAIRQNFQPLEDLRNEINPIRVLHSAVSLAGIARTGLVQPLLGPLSEEDERRVAEAAEELLSWERDE
jgi:dihydrodipicolinate synthase/N-acetylneuraminate lyase